MVDLLWFQRWVQEISEYSDNNKELILRKNYKQINSKIEVPHKILQQMNRYTTELKIKENPTANSNTYKRCVLSFWFIH